MLRIIVMIVVVLLTSCTDDGGGPTDTFDRKAMLTDVADELIVPSYDELWVNATTLQQRVDAFTAQPSEATLDTCKRWWVAVATSWQDAVTFDFGPAEGLYGKLSENVATFPASAQKIETFVTNGDTLLNNFDRDSRGIYGVEYLLFSTTPVDVVSAFTGAEGANRSAYLRSIVRRLLSEIADVRNQWKNGYRDEFISRNGTDAGSGTSLLFNHLNMSFELLKNYKLALPLGKRAGQVTTEPTRVEAYYSGISKDLMDRHYTAVMRLWYGTALSGEKILGFSDYLATVSGGERLINDTKTQDQAIVRELQALGSTMILSETITTSPSSLEPLYTEMFKLTRFIKSEMSSLLGISITYSSGDGD